MCVQCPWLDEWMSLWQHSFIQCLLLLKSVVKLLYSRTENLDLYLPLLQYLSTKWILIFTTLHHKMHCTCRKTWVAQFGEVHFNSLGSLSVWVSPCSVSFKGCHTSAAVVERDTFKGWANFRSELRKSLPSPKKCRAPQEGWLEWLKPCIV